MICCNVKLLKISSNVTLFSRDEIFHGQGNYAFSTRNECGDTDNVQLADKIMLCLQSMHSSILRKGNFNFIYIYIRRHFLPKAYYSLIKTGAIH